MPDYACQSLVRYADAAASAEIGPFWVNIFVRCSDLAEAEKKLKEFLHDQGWVAARRTDRFLPLSPGPRCNATCELLLATAGFYLEMHPHVSGEAEA